MYRSDSLNTSFDDVVVVDGSVIAPQQPAQSSQSAQFNSASLALDADRSSETEKDDFTFPEETETSTNTDNADNTDHLPSEAELLARNSDRSRHDDSTLQHGSRAHSRRHTASRR